MSGDSGRVFGRISSRFPAGFALALAKSAFAARNMFFTRPSPSPGVLGRVVADASFADGGRGMGGYKRGQRV